MQFYLKQIFERCFPIEQRIVLELSKSDNFLSREDLKNTLDLSTSDLINGLQSLQQRYLIQRDQNLFQLSSIFKEYIKSDRI
jgi:predicted transcriptional regulator